MEASTTTMIANPYVYDVGSILFNGILLFFVAFVFIQYSFKKS